VVEETGLIEGLNLLLSDQPNRFDIVVTPDPRKATPEMPLPPIGTLDAVGERMSQLALKLTAIKDYPAADRLAFGVTLFQVAFNRSDALRALEKVFPELTRNLRKSSDFVFQINHPLKEEVEDIPLEIHYLQRWYFAELKLPAGPNTGPLVAFTANVDLDISTALSPARKFSAADSAQIIPHLIAGAARVLEG
jgi:hypothetical protein